MTRHIPLVLITAGILLFGVTVAAALTPPPVDPVEIEEELEELVEKHDELVEEHAALQEWVAKELRPWVIEQAEEVAETIPSGSPTPSLAPLPPVPSASTAPSPTPLPTDIPSPSLPPSPIPDPCLPVICLPSPGETPGSTSTAVRSGMTTSFAPSGSW